jgi:ribosomal-protein-alanine N-acetyltransferase
MRIETERLLLREYINTDWETVHEYARQGDILIYEAWGPNHVQDTLAFIELVINDQIMQPRIRFDLAIILKNENKLIGGCRFGFTDSSQTRGSVGYIINPHYWKNGYATEATIALINHITTLYNLTIIEATCDVLNTASQKVLAACGFKLKATIEKDFEMKGRYRDTYVYEKLM